MRLRILVLPGDGIGPEVTREAVRVLQRVAAVFGHDLELHEALIGGAAIRAERTPLPSRTEALARLADATLLGAVGLPEFDGIRPDERPEKGLLRLRAALGVFANLRPVRTHAASLRASPLKPDVVAGTDLVIVRELTSGLYYGTPRGIDRNASDTRAVNTLSYTRSEIERIARLAFELARERHRHVTSVDKSNVLETSQLWREVVTEVARDFPGVTLDHLFVDTCAMQIVLNPRRFDVLLMENLFGDILSDEAAVLAGSIGLLASASLGGRQPSGSRRGLYEPVHGSAPDIAGTNTANPLGAIGSAAAMLRYSFGLMREAASIDAAVERVLAAGALTADLQPEREPASTAAVGQAVCDAIES